MGNKKKKTLKQKIYEKGGLDNYKYIFQLNINQQCVLENEWYDLDIIDIAIFHAIYKFITLGKPQEHMDSDNVRWYWVCESKIISDLPLVPISSAVGISKRIDKLIKYKLIKRKPDNKTTKLKMIALGEDAGKVFYKNNNKQI